MQLDMMKDWIDRSNAREEERTRFEGKHEKFKLTKLTEAEDIESYITTFERIMTEYEVEEDKWALKLAPQLTGKVVQQAYAALNAEDALQYVKVKEAILRRYNISDETYRHHFRSTRRKEGEASWN